MNALSYLWRSLLMEKIKVSRTLVLWLAFFAPAFVVLVAFVAAYADGDKFYKPGVNPWLNFSGHVLVGWALFVFPIYVSLQSALYAAIEHQNRAFAYLYSLPVPRWSIYASKLLVLTVLTGLSHVALYGSAEAAGWLLGLLKPHYGFQNHSMHEVLLKATLRMFLGGGGIMVIQLFISIQFASFIIPAGFGLFATMAGVISRGFTISTASPYLWPICFLNNSLDMTDWRYSYLLVSIVVFVLGAVVSIQVLNRKDIV
nr:ABC transporter permease [uncultured Dyadobacter sp.]